MLVEIFSTHDECQDIRRVSKNSQKSQKKAREKKACLNFIGASQHVKQTYKGNFVYQGINGLSKSTLGNNGLSRSILVTSGLSVRKSE